MILIVFFIVFVLIILLTHIAYVYFEKCRQLRHQLSAMGIGGTRFSKSLKAYYLPYLKDLIYEKETEAADRCYSSSSNYLN